MSQVIQFIRVGRYRIATTDVRGVDEDERGAVTVHLVGGTCIPVNSEDGKALIEWADSNLIIGISKKEEEKAKAKAEEKAAKDAEHEAAEAVKLEAKAEAKAAHDVAAAEHHAKGKK
jgi:hypothetical protein